MTERSDIHNSSFVNRHSSIPALPGWVLGIGGLGILYWGIGSGNGECGIGNWELRSGRTEF